MSEVGSRETDARARRRKGLAGLCVAALAVAGMGLGGPLMLVATGDPSPALPYYPLGWAAAIGGWLYWLRCWRAATRALGPSEAQERPRA